MCVIYVNNIMLFNSPIKGWMPQRMKGMVSANESVWYLNGTVNGTLLHYYPTNFV